MTDPLPGQYFAVPPLPTEPVARASLWSLARQSVGFSVGGLAYKLVALVSVPILARLLAPTQLGLLDLVAMGATLVGMSIGLGTENAVARFQPRATEEGRVWGAAALLVSAAAAAAVLLGVVMREPLALALIGSAARSDLILASLAYGVTIAGVTFALNIVRLRGSAAHYAMWGFGLVATEMLSAIGLAILLPNAVVAIAWTWALISGLGAFAIARRQLGELLFPSMTMIKRMLRFGLPLLPATAAWVLGDIGIRAAIAHTGDLRALGEYGVAFRIASVLTLLIGGFALAWHPFLYRTAQVHVSAVAVRAGIGLLAILVLIGVLLAAAAPVISTVVAGPAYARSAAAVPALAGGMVAFGLFTILAAVEGVEYRTLPIAAASLIGMLVQVGSAFALLPQLGLQGAGLASLFGYGTGAALLALDVLVRIARR